MEKTNRPLRRKTVAELETQLIRMIRRTDDGYETRSNKLAGYIANVGNDLFNWRGAMLDMNAKVSDRIKKLEDMDADQRNMVEAAVKAVNKPQTDMIAVINDKFTTIEKRLQSLDKVNENRCHALEMKVASLEKAQRNGMKQRLAKPRKPLTSGKRMDLDQASDYIHPDLRLPSTNMIANGELPKPMECEIQYPEQKSRKYIAWAGKWFSR